MRWPLVTRKRHDRELNAEFIRKLDAQKALAVAQNESAQWRVEYRKIRDRIVDIATHPDATPQIRATLSEFARFRP